MRRAALTTAVAAAFLAPAGALAEVHVYPEGVAVTVARECDSLLLIPGVTMDVTVSIVNGTASALRGVVYVEHIPAIYGVETTGVAVDGLPVGDFLHEVSPHDIYPETDVHRWVLEEPAGRDERSNPIPPGGELVINYRLTSDRYHTNDWPPFIAFWECEAPVAESGCAWSDETLRFNADDDGDGMADVFELAYFSDLSHDGTADGDGDGLTDLAEYCAGANPGLADTDGDGLGDGAEVTAHGTSPILPDTDGDGLGDGEEVNVHGTDPLSADTDRDSLSDDREIAECGTDPLNADTDGDGLNDYEEVMYDGAPAYAPYDPAVRPSGTDLDAGRPDSDRDGYGDYLETMAGSDPLDGAARPEPLRISFGPSSSPRTPGFCPAGVEGFSPRGLGWR